MISLHATSYTVLSFLSPNTANCLSLKTNSYTNLHANSFLLISCIIDEPINSGLEYNKALSTNFLHKNSDKFSKLIKSLKSFNNSTILSNLFPFENFFK